MKSGFALATSDEIARELGARLRAQRIAQSLTQQQLAGRAGIAVGAVKTLESSGRSTLATVVRVVQALALTAELETLLQPQAQTSIAALERAELASKRQRVRRPRSA